MIRCVCCRRFELEILYFSSNSSFLVLYYFQDRLLRYCWGCDVKYIGSGYSVGIAGGIMSFFRDFEDVVKGHRIVED